MQKQQTRNAKSRGARPKGSPEPPVLYPYQQRWLADTSRLKAGMFARQTGKTFTAALEIVLDCTDAEDAGSASRWVILSRSERQAREAMEEGVKRHLSTLQRAYDYVENDGLASAKVQVLEVRLPGVLVSGASTARAAVAVAG